MGTLEKYVTTAEAAAIIGCSAGRVRQLVRDGLISAEKLGARTVLVDRKDAERVRDSPAKTGRPRKNSNRT